MNTRKANNEILADLLWIEYEEAAWEARWYLSIGDKLAALAMAIYANKIRSKYENVLWEICCED